MDTFLTILLATYITTNIGIGWMAATHGMPAGEKMDVALWVVFVLFGLPIAIAVWLTE